MFNNLKIREFFSAVMLIACMGMVASGSAWAATIIVPTDKPTIQSAIDAANDGDTVEVSPGTYFENIKFGNKNIIVKSKEGATKTIIDGNKQESVVTFIHDGDITLGATATLQGFTITNGIGTPGNDDTYRPEFYAGNRLGGGILCHKTKPVLTDLIITQNSAQRGGGIFGRGSEPTVIKTVISKNTALVDGGGVAFISGWLKRPIFKNVLIFENTATGNGGGVFIDYSTQPTIINATISKNTSGYGLGGAINIANQSGVNLSNSIIWDNGSNSISWRGGVGYTSQISYSIVKSGQSDSKINWGTGNIDADPQFVGNGDYHLSVSSPALGKGTSSDAPTYDLDGNPRPYPVDSAPDMGAYEDKSTDPDSNGILIDMDISTANYEDINDVESDLSVHENDEIWVCVVARGVTDLDTYQVEVFFDTGKLEFLEGAEENPIGGIKNLLKKNGGTTTGFLAVEKTPGTVNISNTLTGADCNQAPEGSGAVALLKFKVLNAGPNSELTPDNAFFVDCTGNNKEITELQNGTFVGPDSIPGDFNTDGKVDFLDLGLLANYWLLQKSDSAWNAKYDLEEDGIINYLDLSILGDHWLEEN